MGRKVREEEDLKGREDRSEEDERGTEEERRREGRKKMRIWRGRIERKGGKVEERKKIRRRG